MRRSSFTITWNDLCNHKGLRLVFLTIGAARQPLVLVCHWTGAICGAVWTIAVGADGKSALLACPVNVKERRIAHVAHLTHSLNWSLPRHFGWKTTASMQKILISFPTITIITIPIINTIIHIIIAVTMWLIINIVFDSSVKKLS